MKKLLACFLVFVIYGVTIVEAKEKEIVQSTQGVEIDQNITKSLKKTSEEKKEAKQKQKTSKDYLKEKKQKNKLEKKLHYKQRELDFLNHRLELKQKKLEEINSAETEKGE